MTDKWEVTIKCPACKNEHRVPIETMHPGESFTCERCGAVVKFTGDDGREVQAAIDRVKAAFKKLGKK